MTEDRPPYATDYPENIADAIDRLIKEIPLRDQVRINSMDQDDLTDLHFGLGQYIRNKYGLWKGNDRLLKECTELVGDYGIDADGASMIILEAFWKRLREIQTMRVVK